MPIFISLESDKIGIKVLFTTLFHEQNQVVSFLLSIVIVVVVVHCFLFRFHFCGSLFIHIDRFSIDASLEDLWFHSIYKNTNEIESTHKHGCICNSAGNCVLNNILGKKDGKEKKRKRNIQ